MNWRLKVVKRAVLARVPFGNMLRRLKRRLFGYEPDPAKLHNTLSNYAQMKAVLATEGRLFEGASVLEIGSGWFPTIPIMLTLDGAKHITMSDLTRHMDDVTFAATMEFLQNTFPENLRLQDITRFDELPVVYMAPFDASAIADESIDFVISRTVLEHIAPKDLADLLAALRPKLVPDGLMVHVIDNSDHLEHSDKSVSKINFLTWTERKHALVNVLMKGGENRLRHHEYLHIFERAGFRVISETMKIHELTRAIAKTLPLTAPYSSMSADQLAALSSIYVIAASRPTSG